MKALLVGREPGCGLGFQYAATDYEAVVIGSLTLGEVLKGPPEPVLEALAKGTRVLLYTPGLPQVTHNRALAASVASRLRELKSWGIVFTDGSAKRLITAQEARAMAARGEHPRTGALLTPLAKEILQGKDG